MRKQPSKTGRTRAAGRSARPAPKPGTAAQTRRGRGERRKAETRARLMRAALKLMSERGMYGVAINEITEAADVGFGSFYNHFESKEAIHAAIVDEAVTRFAQALSQVADVLEDPAEIFTASVRTIALRAQRDPVWGKFLVRSVFSVSTLEGGMGSYMMRDIQRGIDSGRFRCDDLLATTLTVGGAALFTIDAALEFSLKGSASIRVAKRLNLETEDIAARGAAAALRLLGLPGPEADAISHRPLPEIDLPPAPF